MTAITISSFGSSVPRLADHLLPQGGSAKAIDCKLWHGTLESWYEPLHVRDTPENTGTSILHDCCWLDFEGCVDIAEGPTNCRQLFMTGVDDYPIVMEFLDPEEPCAPTVRRLGLPCPDRPPSFVIQPVDPDRSAPKDVEGRSYAYQYVNADGERSALSPGTQAQNIRDGQAVMLSGWVEPDASWGITEVHIFRTVTTHQDGREAGNEASTIWMRVTRIPITDSTFVDDRFNDELTVALMEDVATPPPENLRGIVWVQSMNVLAGYVGNRVYFSENNNYHHWPYYFDLDDNVRGLVESNNVIYAATDGYPYAIQGAVDCENAGCREIVRLAHPLPLLGVGNRKMAAVSAGAVYPSEQGLVLLSGNSEPNILTWSYYSPDNWQRLIPESVIPVQHLGRLFVFARGGSFVMTMGNNVEGGWEMDNHSELSDKDVTDAFVRRNGELYIVKEGAVYEWNKGLRLRPHEFHSPEVLSPTPLALSAGRVLFTGGPESVIIRADDRQVYERTFLRRREFRLPTRVFGSSWRFILKGTATVKIFSVATSMRSLGR